MGLVQMGLVQRNRTPESIGLHWRVDPSHTRLPELRTSSFLCLVFFQKTWQAQILSGIELPVSPQGLFSDCRGHRDPSVTVDVYLGITAEDAAFLSWSSGILPAQRAAVGVMIHAFHRYR